MRVAILKTCFKPGESKTRTILKRNSTPTLTDEEAEVLIEKGYAAELKAEKAEAPKKEKATKAEAPKKDSEPKE